MGQAPPAEFASSMIACMPAVPMPENPATAASGMSSIILGHVRVDPALDLTAEVLEAFRGLSGQDAMEAKRAMEQLAADL
ncbi:MAG TPA: hypothetical protein PKM36_10875 [Propionibacteriaceae bacterium]|nr:hypothetical protein [Propionibacteriaceae bacterium]